MEDACWVMKVTDCFDGQALLKRVINRENTPSVSKCGCQHEDLPF